MLLTLKHLLLTATLMGVGAALAGGIAHEAYAAGLPEVFCFFFVLAGMAVTVFGLGWPLCRFMHLRPMVLPLCPHCGKRHGNYHIPPEAWPCAVLICVSCGKPTILYLSRKKPMDVKPDIPGLYLRWPEILGCWRRVPDPKATIVKCPEGKGDTTRIVL
jgi:hypothetical protein